MAAYTHYSSLYPYISFVLSARKNIFAPENAPHAHVCN